VTRVEIQIDDFAEEDPRLADAVIARGPSAASQYLRPFVKGEHAVFVKMSRKDHPESSTKSDVMVHRRPLGIPRDAEVASTADRAGAS
jgi:hypothetical protein